MHRLIFLHIHIADEEREDRTNEDDDGRNEEDGLVPVDLRLEHDECDVLRILRCGSMEGTVLIDEQYIVFDA